MRHTFPSHIALTLTALVIAISARAESLVCNGVLGNSGEQGSGLVRYGNVGASAKGAIGGGKAAGIGVVCDKSGSLWDRGGSGTLNRYAPDGRLLAQYRIPAGIGGSDQLTLAGDTLVLQIANQIYTLPVDAPAGTEAKALKRESSFISFGSREGSIATFSKGAISLLNVASGEAKEIAQVKDLHALELGPDGAIYYSRDNKINKIVDGKEVSEGWPRSSPGERMQLLDGKFYGSAWHGTIRRFTAELEPDPGVVLGGASGSFIGHLDQNSELSNSRGLAKVRENLFAVSGFSGTLHLMEWDGTKRQFQIVRRIGAAPVCSGLGLDKSGNIWWHYGSWKWNERPDAPIQQGVNNPEELGQAVILNNDRFVAPAWMWGKPAFYFGSLDDELKIDRVEKNCALMHQPAASVAYRSGRELVLLAIDAGGKGQTFQIGDDGRYQKDLVASALKTASPVKAWTSLGTKDGTTLIGAADGAVIELAPDGADWKETRRWSSWGDGADEKFGEKIFLSCDGGRLWVSDSARHRVIAFNLSDGKPLAVFGAADGAGNDLKSLSTPQTIAARGERAVVHDRDNQRLVKLRLK